jgi:hypothetical protein
VGVCVCAAIVHVELSGCDGLFGFVLSRLGMDYYRSTVWCVWLAQARAMRERHVREKCAAAATAMKDASPLPTYTRTAPRRRETHTPQSPLPVLLLATATAAAASSTTAHCKRQPLVTNSHRCAWLPGHDSNAAPCPEIPERPRRRRKDMTGGGVGCQ